MITHKYWIVALTVSFFFAGCVASAPSPRVLTSVNTDVSLTVSLAAQFYKVSQPIKFAIKLFNRSSEEIYGSRANGHAEFTIKITDASGRDVQYTRLGKELLGPYDPTLTVMNGSFFPVGVGQTYEQDVDLSQCFQFNPGSYHLTIVMGYIRHSTENGTGGIVSVRDLTFEVVE